MSEFQSIGELALQVVIRLLFIRRHPAGLTAEEVSTVLGRSLAETEQAIDRLHSSGEIEKIGQHRNSGGKPSNIWRASDKARKAAA